MGQGGSSPGVMGVGSLREAGEEGYQKGVGAGRNGKNFATLAQYFAIGKAHRGGTATEGGGNGECRVREVGSSDPSVPPPPPSKYSQHNIRPSSYIKSFQCHYKMNNKIHA